MIIYLNIIDQLRAKLTIFKIQQIPRDGNVRVDLLAYLGATMEGFEEWIILVTILH